MIFKANVYPIFLHHLDSEHLIVINQTGMAF